LGIAYYSALIGLDYNPGSVCGILAGCHVGTIAFGGVNGNSGVSGTNATAVIMSAVNAVLRTGGGSIQIEQGKYILPSGSHIIVPSMPNNIGFPSRLSIVGDGSGNVFLIGNYSGFLMSFTGTGSYGGGFLTLQGFTLQNLASTPGNSTYPGMGGLTISHVRGTWLQDLAVASGSAALNENLVPGVNAPAPPLGSVGIDFNQQGTGPQNVATSLVVSSFAIGFRMGGDHLTWSDIECRYTSSVCFALYYGGFQDTVENLHAFDGGGNMIAVTSAGRPDYVFTGVTQDEQGSLLTNWPPRGASINLGSASGYGLTIDDLWINNGVAGGGSTMLNPFTVVTTISKAELPCVHIGEINGWSVVYQMSDGRVVFSNRVSSSDTTQFGEQFTWEPGTDGGIDSPSFQVASIGLVHYRATLTASFPSQLIWEFDFSGFVAEGQSISFPCKFTGTPTIFDPGKTGAIASVNATAAAFAASGTFTGIVWVIGTLAS
jgi:hypothetical protein